MKALFQVPMPSLFRPPLPPRIAGHQFCQQCGVYHRIPKPPDVIDDTPFVQAPKLSSRTTQKSRRFQKVKS
jgi:hypothetical protein